MTQKYELGESLVFHRFNSFDKPDSVTVAALRKNGCAKLSNGWVVDDEGRAEGTGRMPGGYVSRDGEAQCQ